MVTTGWWTVLLVALTGLMASCMTILFLVVISPAATN